MPRQKKIPPFVPLPWISDPDTSSIPGSSASEGGSYNTSSSIVQHQEVPYLQPGVHPGLQLPQLPEHVQHLPHQPSERGEQHNAAQSQVTHLQPGLHLPLRLPIDADRGMQHYAGQSQGTATNSYSTTLPNSSQQPPSVPSSDPSFSAESSFSEDSEEEFSNILDDLVKQWLLVELTHNVSKHATETFWKLAVQFFPLLSSFNGKKLLQFQQLRKRLYSEYVPDIGMCVTFEDRSTHELHHLQDITCIPKNRFPPHQFKKLYETAKVQASFNI